MSLFAIEPLETAPRNFLAASQTEWVYTAHRGAGGVCAPGR